jgi:hypothetical protein
MIIFDVKIKITEKRLLQLFWSCRVVLMVARTGGMTGMMREAPPPLWRLKWFISARCFASCRLFQLETGPRGGIYFDLVRVLGWGAGASIGRIDALFS